jgi:SRSO17 transposase
VEFATKPDLAAHVVKRQACGGKLGIRWVAADEVCGRSSRFRAVCEDAGLTYGLAVPEDFQVATKAGAFRADGAALAEGTFERRSCGPGSKGPRCHDWALVATASPAISSSSAARPATQTTWRSSTACA